MSDDLPILKGILKQGMAYQYSSVRFGRVPKREKQKILEAMQYSSARSQEKALSAELEDDQKMMATVVGAHLETCDFTSDKIAPMLVRARQQPVYTSCPPTLACPLNPNPQPMNGQHQLLQDFSERFSPAIRGVVEFAKRIPGFSLLSQDDQVTLLKAGVFEVLLVRLARMFDSQTNTMICLNGQVLKREALHNSSNARFLMDSMFDFADRLNSLGLSDAEVGLFSAIVVIASDRPGLRNTDLIEKMQNKLRVALQQIITQQHPNNPCIFQELIKKIPDLRTLNTLHSEKLLAFKMTEQQQQMQVQMAQQHLYQGWEENNSKGSWEEGSKSPNWSECNKDSEFGSPNSGDTAYVIDEGVKSPMGSVSSSESVCCGELAAITELRNTQSNQIIQNSLTVLVPKRRRDKSHSEGGSTSSDECSSVGDSPGKCPFKVRKLDSPNDSGIESGTENFLKLSSSTSTSVCSSPRSSLEDKVKDIEEQSDKHESIEDMPVLKRALQAPPLFDTNSLMDEAYKPHKKFRHGALSTSSSSSTITRKEHSESEGVNSSFSNLTLSQALSCPSLTSTHSTLTKSLMEGPKMTAEQIKRTEIIHNIIMNGEIQQHSHRTETVHSPQNSIPCPPTSNCVVPQSNGPMAGAVQPSKNVVMCSLGYYIPQGVGQQPQVSLQDSVPAWSYAVGNRNSVTQGGQVRPSAVQYMQPVIVSDPSSLPPVPVQPSVQPQPKVQLIPSATVTSQQVTSHSTPTLPQPNNQMFSRMFFDSRTSPQPIPHRSQSSSQQRTPTPTGPSLNKVPSSPKVVELQVDVTDSQPLNLSKKTPPPPKILLEA